MMSFNIYDYSIRRTCFAFYEKHSKHQTKTVIKMIRHPGGGTSRDPQDHAIIIIVPAGDKYLNISKKNK